MDIDKENVDPAPTPPSAKDSAPSGGSQGHNVDIATSRSQVSDGNVYAAALANELSLLSSNIDAFAMAGESRLTDILGRSNQANSQDNRRESVMTQLKETLMATPFREIAPAILHIIPQPHASKVLRSCFRVLLRPVDDSTIKLYSRLLKLTFRAMTEEEEHRPGTEIFNEIVGVMQYAIFSMPPSVSEISRFLYTLEFVLGRIVGVIRNGDQALYSMIDLLEPICNVFCRYSKRDDILLSDGQRVDEYQHFIIEELCEQKWGDTVITKILNNLKGIEMAEDEVLVIIKKCKTSMLSLHTDELPGAAYQLMHFAEAHTTPTNSKTQRFVVDTCTAIIKVLAQHDLVANSSARSDESPNADSSDIREDTASQNTHSILHLRHTEGTVLMHLRLMFGTNKSLGKVISKKFLSGEIALGSPSTIAVLLNLADQQNHPSRVYDFCADKLISEWDPTDKQSMVRNWTAKGALKDGPPGFSRVLLELIDCSRYGWDGMISHALEVLHSGFRKVASKYGLIALDSNLPEVAQQLIILTEHAFATSSPHRYAILRDICMKVSVAHNDKQRRKELGALYAYALRFIIKRNRSECLGFSSLLGDTLLEVTVMDHSLSFIYIDAMSLLFPYMHSLRNGLEVMIRKSFFSTVPSVQMVASYCLVKLNKIAADAQRGRSSQMSQGGVPMSQTSFPGLDDGITGAVAFPDLLSKIIDEDSFEKSVLYGYIIAGKPLSSETRDFLLAVQCARLQLFSPQSESAMPPLYVDQAVDSKNGPPRLLEPLHALMDCITSLLLSYSQTDAAESSEYDKAVSLMDSLYKRFAQSDLEDFSLDKQSVYSNKSDIGVTNLLKASLMLRLFDSCVSYAFTIGKDMSSMVTLAGKARKLEEAIGENGAHIGGKRVGAFHHPSGITRSSIAPMSLMKITDYLFLEEDATNINRPHDSGSVQLLKFIMTKLNDACALLKQSASHQPPVTGIFCAKALRQLIIQTLKYAKEMTDGLINCEKNGTDTGIMAINTLCIALEACMALPGNRAEDLLRQALDGGSETWSSVVFNLVQLCSDSQVAELAKCKSLLLGTLESLVRTNWTSCHANLHKNCLNLALTNEAMGNTDVPACKALVRVLFMTLPLEDAKSIRIIWQFAQDIANTGVNEDSATAEQGIVGILTPASARVLAVEVLKTTETMIGYCADAIVHLSSTLPGTAAQNGGSVVLGPQDTQNDRPSGNEGQDQLGMDRSVCNEQLFTSLCFLTAAMAELSTYKPVENEHFGLLLRCFRALYGAITATAKYVSKSAARQSFSGANLLQRLVNRVVALTPRALEMLTLYQQRMHHAEKQNRELHGDGALEDVDDSLPKSKGGKGKKRKAAGIKGALRTENEAVAIPGLVFAIETCERYLIEMDQKTKKNFTKNMKRSTVRDFKLTYNRFRKERSDDSDDDNREKRMRL
eukprot:Clim_evm46s147 gene=Clim_evmTU46s147